MWDGVEHTSPDPVFDWRDEALKSRPCFDGLSSNTDAKPCVQTCSEKHACRSWRTVTKW